MAVKVINPAFRRPSKTRAPGYFHLGVPIGGAMDRLPCARQPARGQ